MPMAQILHYHNKLEEIVQCIKEQLIITFLCMMFSCPTLGSIMAKLPNFVLSFSWLTTLNDL
jgi:hypothetical protein